MNISIKSLFGLFNKDKPQQPRKNPNHVTYQDYSAGGYNNYMTYNSLSSYSEDKSLCLSAVYRCIEVISDSVAMLPIEVYEVDKKGFKNIINNPLTDILSKRPNKNQTPFTLIKSLITSMLIKGNGYLHIIRDQNNNVTDLLPLNPDFVIPTLNRDGEVFYKYGNLDIPNKDVIHLLNFTYDGITGVSTLRHAQKTLSITADSENHASNFFKSGANVGGILKTEGILTEEQKIQIKTGWQSAYSGQGNGVAILDGNFNFQPISINPSDAQLLETRQFNVVDICRFFGVSPIKAFDLTAANYSTVEATQLSFLTDTLSPILTKLEQELTRKLFPGSSIQVNFDESALLRIDKQSQAEFYTKLINCGIITPNEARLEMGFTDKPEADELFLQVNMQKIKDFKPE